MSHSTFTFEGGYFREAEKTDDVVEQLAKMAGGVALPGAWGLVQSLATTWTQPMSGPPWLRALRCTLMSAGAVVAYRKERSPEAVEERSDKIKAYIDAKGLGTVKDIEQVRGLAFVYLNAHDPFEDSKIAGTEFVVRRFRCGLHAIFYDEREVRDCEAGKWQPVYMVAAERDAARVVDSVRDAVWAGVGGDIDFAATINRYGDATFSLSRLRPAGDYVDRPENGEAAVLATLADRCLRFAERGLRRRILFYGPPGTGKTVLSRKLGQLVSHGRALRMDPVAVSRSGNARLFEMVALLQPAVVILDDLDRADGVDGLLNLVEESDAAPLLIASVNAIDRLDPALLRPGRFDEAIYVGPPGVHWRRDILAHYAERFALDGSANLDHLADATDGFSPAELLELVKVCSVVGLDMLDVELDRLRRQASFYADGAVSRHLARRDGGNAPTTAKPS